MDVGLSLGSTGLGVDLSMPVTDWVKARAGVSYLSGFQVPMNFNLSNYSDVGQSSFDNISGIMKDLTGFEIDRNIRINGNPKMLNFSLLFDVYPFRNNRHWHFTAGSYFGPQKMATAINDISEMTTLVSVGLYNSANNIANYLSSYLGDYLPEKLADYLLEINIPNTNVSIYDFIYNELYWDVPIYGDFFLDPNMAVEIRDYLDKLQSGELNFDINVNLNLDAIGVSLGTFTHDMYQDPATGKYVKHPEKGKTYIKHNAGERYMMKPDKDATISANALSNIVRPYLGFGYGGYLDKTKRWNASFDCGAIFWGGAPRILTHEGVDLIRDVEGISGKVGRYVDIASAMKIYPVLNFRISYTLF